MKTATACILRKKLMKKIEFDLSRDEKKQLEELKNSISKKLESFKQLDEKAKQQKNTDIKSMIRYYNGMTDKIEDRRIRIHNSTLQLLAICVTGAGLLTSQYQTIIPVLFWVIMPVLLIQIVSSLVSIISYTKQASFRYPFLCLKRFGNKWKWFYYGNKEVLKINTAAILGSNKFNETLEPYLKGLKNFVRNYREENLDEEISNNVQQLYLLQVHNYYKNRFYLQLVRIREWSLYPTVAVITGILIAALISFLILP